MSELLPRLRMQTQQGLFFSFEKCGLRLENQPIAWNANDVLVEALLRLPVHARKKSDFSLRLPNSDPIPPESVKQEPNQRQHRLFFRIPTPSQSTTAQLFWQARSLGELELPVLQRPDFFKHLSLQMPTVMVNIGPNSIACQTFVSTQARGLVASGLLTAPTSLVPIVDMQLEVEFRHDQRQEATQRVPVLFSSSQLHGKQALVTVSPQNLSRRMGTWTITWLLEGEPIHTQKIKAISKRDFERSLRISQTRFVVQNEAGIVSLHRTPPHLNSNTRVGPCFLVSSRESGIAGLCTLQTRAQVSGAVTPPILLEQEVLISDGPTPFTPGTLEASELEQVTAFELSLGNQRLGILAMTPAPSASFTAEGSFAPAPDFTWTNAAEDQLVERLTRLMDSNGTS